jgi:hypothetical protein
MTKLEIMQLVKECPDKPARGIDPLTGREVPEGEVFTGKTNSVQTVRKSCRVYGVLLQSLFLF